MGDRHHEARELEEEPPTDPDHKPPTMKEGLATGIYRLTMEGLDKNLEEKKATRSSVERLVKHVDAFAQKTVVPKKAVGRKK